METEPIGDGDSSEEEPEGQYEDWTYASMEESTTESECNDDSEEQSTADVRWEYSQSYLTTYNLQKRILHYSVLKI